MRLYPSRFAHGVSFKRKRRENVVPRVCGVSENGSEKSRDRIRLRACGQNDDGRLRICDGRARKSVCDGDRCGVLSGKQLFEEAAIYRKQYEASLALVRRVHGVRTGGRIRARRWQ